MLTGDTVLGRSAPVILDPDGRVDAMLTWPITTGSAGPSTSRHDGEPVMKALR